MKRAYKLDLATICKLVPEGKPGTYFLGEKLDDRFYVLYVGRSDACLRTRLLQHANAGIFNFFRFRMSRSTTGAFKKECYAFHSYKELKNKVHPANNGTCNCPICSCVDEFQTALPDHNLN